MKRKRNSLKLVYHCMNYSSLTTQYLLYSWEWINKISSDANIFIRFVEIMISGKRGTLVHIALAAPNSLVGFQSGHRHHQINLVISIELEIRGRELPERVQMFRLGE